MNSERINALKQEYAQSQDTRRFDEFIVDRLIEAEERAQVAEKKVKALLRATSAMPVSLSDFLGDDYIPEDEDES